MATIRYITHRSDCSPGCLKSSDSSAFMFFSVLSLWCPTVPLSSVSNPLSVCFVLMQPLGWGELTLWGWVARPSGVHVFQMRSLAESWPMNGSRITVICNGYICSIYLISHDKMNAGQILSPREKTWSSHWPILPSHISVIKKNWNDSYPCLLLP